MAEDEAGRVRLRFREQLVGVVMEEDVGNGEDDEEQDHGESGDEAGVRAAWDVRVDGWGDAGHVDLDAVGSGGVVRVRLRLCSCLGLYPITEDSRAAGGSCARVCRGSIRWPDGARKPACAYRR